MKWRWAWRLALLLVAVWVAYVGAIVGLGQLSGGGEPMAPQPSSWRRAAMSVHRAAAGPGEALVNGIWRCGTHRLCPFEREVVPEPGSGRWRLFPRVMLVARTVGAAPGKALPPGIAAPARLPTPGVVGAGGYSHSFTWGDAPWGFPLHLLLLPGVLVAVVGLLLGLGLGALRGPGGPEPEAGEPRSGPGGGRGR